MVIRGSACAVADETWIMTASGIAMHPLAPSTFEITIADIAHALAAVPRFCGHTRVPYSVAQHCVHVSVYTERYQERDASDTAKRESGLFGLLHDASEAYLCDVPRPLKRHAAFAEYRRVEARLQACIYQRFGLSADCVPSLVREIDLRMLRTEQRDLMPPAVVGEDRNDAKPLRAIVVPRSSAKAERRFLARYSELIRAR